MNRQGKTEVFGHSHVHCDKVLRHSSNKDLPKNNSVPPTFLGTRDNFKTKQMKFLHSRAVYVTGIPVQMKTREVKGRDTHVRSIDV